MNKQFQTLMQHRVAYTPQGLAFRSAAEDTPDSIEGVAIVTGTETILYECSEYREIEVIEPSCISKEFIDGQDIKLNLHHNREESIARCNKGKGTLVLESREDGLHFAVPVPDCDLGKRAAALIANGTYTGCSFEFFPKEYQFEERKGSDGKCEYIIRHTAFDTIGAITICLDPAYPTTSVGLREKAMEDHLADPTSPVALAQRARQQQYENEAIRRSLDELDFLF